MKRILIRAKESPREKYVSDFEIFSECILLQDYWRQGKERRELCQKLYGLLDSEPDHIDLTNQEWEWLYECSQMKGQSFPTGWQNRCYLGLFANIQDAKDAPKEE